MITKVCFFFSLPQAIDAFDTKKFHFIILKYKYFELLCIKAEAPNPSKEGAVDELVKVRIRGLFKLEKHEEDSCLLVKMVFSLVLPVVYELIDRCYRLVLVSSIVDIK